MAVCLDYQSLYFQKKTTSVSTPLQIGAAILLLSILAFKVWVKIEITDIGYNLAVEREQTVALDMDRRDLELQRSLLLRADSLAIEAKGRLGMQNLNAQQVRTLKGAS